MSNEIHIALLFFAREGKPLMAWPMYDYDVNNKINQIIKESNNWCGNECKFVIKKWIKTKEDIQEIISCPDNIDGLIIYIVTTSINYNLLYEIIQKLNKPTLVLTEPFYSLAWPEIAELMKNKYPVVGVSSSDKSLLFRAIETFFIYLKIRNKTRTLVITVPEENTLESLHKQEIYSGDRVYSNSYYTKIKQYLDLVFIDYKELQNIYNLMNNEEAKNIASKIIEKSYYVKEKITFDDLVSATKLYLAIKELVKKYDAEAVAINCFSILLKDLNAFSATPCLAVSILNDEGIPAACEADLSSLLLQIIFKHIAKRPAWISDPVIDFKDNSVTYAHCTAPTKMNGYKGEPEEYALDTHDESGKPVVVRTKMKIGQEITVIQISPDFNHIYLRISKIADIPIVDLGCRTKVKTFVKDAKKWLWDYKQPLHRVLVYGDWSYELSILSKFMNMDIVFEPE